MQRVAIDRYWVKRPPNITIPAAINVARRRPLTIILPPRRDPNNKPSTADELITEFQNMAWFSSQPNLEAKIPAV